MNDSWSRSNKFSIRVVALFINKSCESIHVADDVADNVEETHASGDKIVLNSLLYSIS
jgi:hypothetical protein